MRERLDLLERLRWQTAFLICVAAAVGVLAVGCGSSDQVAETPLGVEGVVVDQSGDPLSEALVASGGDSKRYRWEPGEAVTDDRGRFAIEFPPFADQVPQVFVQVTLEVEGPEAGQTLTTHFREPVELGFAGQEIVVPTPRRCPLDLAGMGAASSQQCGNILLPDLVPKLDGLDFAGDQPSPPESLYVDLTTQPGRTLLRFSSATANVGEGILHIVPEAQPVGDRATTWQRIWTDEFTFVDQQAGSFVFHPTHNHFHVDGFERYRLLSTTGEVVATGEKVSFCLTDVVPGDGVNDSLGFGVFVEDACREASEQQVLRPGWADYYGAWLDDQWIDITGVVAGEYIVEITADPDDLLVEADETNNTARFPVSLTPAMLSG